jgi:phytoene dehydrogenase-like protein
VSILEIVVCFVGLHWRKMASLAISPISRNISYPFKKQVCSFRSDVASTHRNIRSRIATSASNRNVKEADVVVIGAGVSGLAASRVLHNSGISNCILLDAADAVGGRVRTDIVDGFLLDHGFQIFLTSYPEAKAILNYDALDLRPFYAGADVRWNGSFHRVADPLRHLADGLGSLNNPIGSPMDKVKVGLYRLRTLLGGLDTLLSAPETTTLQALRNEGFSEEIIDRFFRPFLGGIFFDRKLNVTSRMFAFVMRMLATGQNCLPAGGIGAVSNQLAASLPASSVRLNTPVESITTIDTGGIKEILLKSGEKMHAKAVVVATPGPEAARLLGPRLTESSSPSKDAAGVGTTCLYFAAPEPPVKGNMLYLDGGDGTALINNMCFPSEVSSTYAPPGQTLVSMSTIGTRDELSDEELIKQALHQAGEWFGKDKVEGGKWRHLKTYRIPFAQPGQAPPTDLSRPVALGEGVYVCGDHRASATLEGALLSGRAAAEAVLEDLGRRL